MDSVRTPAVIVMGVSGSGKTTVAAQLAERLGWAMVEADDHHPRPNVEKMSRGEALTETDREPWLRSLGDAVAAARRGGKSERGGVVASCSALTRRSRDLLRERAGGDPVFVLLEVSEAELERRVAGRSHFFPPGLLRSQLETLERPGPGEPGCVTVSGEGPTAEVVGRLLSALDLA